jgi:enolase-phosphatase E1
MNVGAVITDIEGTTSSIAFVHEVLFPYAAARLPEYVRAHAGDGQLRALLDETRREAGEPDAGTERLIDILLQWIAEDRKATPLKALQGHVWRQGYEQGDFTGHIYEDAVRNLKRWHHAGIALYIYSSGSVAAQQLMFGNSDAGDLLPLFRGYFDTRIGHKRDVAAYRAITQEIGVPAERILFLSDVVEELDAARSAGMQTVQLVRDQGTATGTHAIARNFDEIPL